MGGVSIANQSEWHKAAYYSGDPNGGKDGESVTGLMQIKVMRFQFLMLIMEILKEVLNQLDIMHIHQATMVLLIKQAM